MKTINMKSLLAYLTDLSIRSRENKASLVYLEDRNSMKYGFHSPWKPLPNTKDFMVTVNKLDPILTEYNLPKRLSPTLKNHPLSSRLNACNRYLRIQLAVLRKFLVAGRTVDFWHRAMMLLAKSKVLRLVALRKLDKNWGRTLNHNLVSTYLRFLDKKIQTLDFRVSYTRRYEPKTKPDGTTTWRPISSPSKPDRMLMYLLSTFFVIFLRYYISPHQHAYQKVKGVNSAWADLKDLKSWPYIYEFDLAGFFPSINISYVFKELKRIGVPSEICNWLLNMSLMYPRPDTLDTSKLDETNAIAKAELDALGLLTTYHKPIFKYIGKDGSYKGVILKPLLEWMEKHGKDALINMMCENDKTVDGLYSFDMGYSKSSIIQEWYPTLYEFYQIQNALNETFFVKTNRPVDPDLRAGVDASPFQKALAEVRDVFRVGEQEWSFQIRNDVLDNEASFKVIPDTHIIGFPQGGALSPILSLVAFEYALWRDHFKARFEKKYSIALASGWLKLVAYADDFILLSKRALSEEWLYDIPTGSKMWSMNIRFSKDKSRWARINNVWQHDALKFLGATYVPSLDLIKGTPRNGTDLLFDKQEMVEAYVARDKVLKEIKAFCNWSESPQAILDKWGMNEEPFCYIPEDVISMTGPLTREALAGLKEATLRATLGEESEDFTIKVDPEGNAQLERIRIKAKRIMGEFREHYKTTGMGGGWLRSPRLLGTIMSRLHSGSWNSVTEFLELNDHRFGLFNRDPLDKTYPNKGSWADVATRTKVSLRSKVNMLNLSSYSTLSLLQAMDRQGNGLKARKGLFTARLFMKPKLTGPRPGGQSARGHHFGTGLAVKVKMPNGRTV